MDQTAAGIAAAGRISTRLSDALRQPAILAQAMSSAFASVVARAT